MKPNLAFAAAFAATLGVAGLALAQTSLPSTSTSPGMTNGITPSNGAVGANGTLNTGTTGTGLNGTINGTTEGTPGMNTAPPAAGTTDDAGTSGNRR